MEMHSEYTHESLEELGKELDAQRAAEETKAEKPEAMVSVDMRKEDSLDLYESQMLLTHTALRPLTAVTEKQAPVHGQCLGAWISVGKGQGRSRAQYRQGEITHLSRAFP